MGSLRQLRSRLAGLFRRRHLEAEMAEEMRQHLERRTQEKIADGLSLDEARYAAQREFGGVAQMQEQCRDERRFVLIEQLAQDVRYAARTLRKSPGFAAVVVLSLALGIGANTTVFSLVNDFLLRALPVSNPEELVLFRYFNGKGGSIPSATEGNSGKDSATGRSWRTSFPVLALERFQAHHPGLTEVFAFAPFGQVTLLIDGHPESSFSGQYVSGNYHAALGVPAVLGRTLVSGDDGPSVPPVAVISHRYWQNRFAGDPAVVGKTIRLNQVVTTIVGVTARGFSGTLQAGESPDISVPLALFTQLDWDRKEKIQPWYFWVRLMGRLAPGANAAQVSAALEPAFQQVAREAWDTRPRPPGAGPEPVPGLPTLTADPGGHGENDRRREYSKTMGLLSGLVGLVLLAACANVANLLLARGASRRREIALRLALGASRGRIVRQLLAESLVLAGTGAALGLLLAWWGRELLLALRPVGHVVALELPLDGAVLAFTIVVAVATSILFGLLPALRATRLDVSAEFQGSVRTLGGGARSRLSRALMVVQLALSLVLLVGTGLFLRTMRNLQAVDPGFNRHGLVLFRVEASASGNGRTQFSTLATRLQERFEKLPGVRAATYSDIALISGRRTGRFITIPGYTPPAGGRAGAMTLAVAPNFFPAMELPLMLGRGFTVRDDTAAPKVAVVSQAFVQNFFPGENVIGRRFSWFPSTSANAEIEIVGVARDANYTDLRDRPNATIYTPLLQQPAFGGVVNFALRTVVDGTALFPEIRAAVREVDPGLPVFNLRTQDEQLDRLNAQPLLFARLSSFFGVLALALACVGLHGLMSFQVVRRTGEIGLRMALGANPAQVLGLIFRESLALVGIGVVVGLVLAAAGSRLVATMLFGLSPTDPLTYGAVAVVLMLVSLVAALLPARRAAKVDPMVALRCE